MTCDETREQFSELVDERLAPGERAEVLSHLGGCAACRAELERFRATVSLFRSVEPVRAPAGFAERVIASARVPVETPVESWWRRLGTWLVFPLPVKLPLEAAAIVLVGIGVAYLYQRTPELQEAARMESPAHVEQSELRAERFASERSTPLSSSEPSTTTLTRPAPSEPPTSTTQSPAPTGAPSAGRQSSTPPTGRVPSEPPPSSPAATLSKDTSIAATEDKKESTEVRAKESRADAARPAPGAGAPPPVAAPAAPEAPRRVLRDAPRERTEESAKAEGQVRQAAPPAAARAPAAREPASGATAQLAMKSGPSNVTGALTVASRATAASALRELAAQHRGRIVGSREEPDATVIEVRVPREGYPALVAGLDAIGRWRAEREPRELPTEVGVTVRLVQ